MILFLLYCGNQTGDSYNTNSSISVFIHYHIDLKHSHPSRASDDIEEELNPQLIASPFIAANASIFIFTA